MFNQCYIWNNRPADIAEADTTMHDALAAEHVTGTSTPVLAPPTQPPKPPAPDAKGSQGGAGGVKKKTKKGKK